MATSVSYPTILYADEEHGRLQVVILILLVLFLVSGFYLIRSLLRMLDPGAGSDFAFILSCTGTLVFSLVIVWGIEKLLKRFWHSGRQIVLNEEGIQALDKKGENITLTWSDNLTGLFWFFHLKGFQRGGRERRVPQQWLCLGAQLLQDGKRVVVYSYMPPMQAEELTTEGGAVYRFHEIFPRDLYKTRFIARLTPPTRPEIPASVIAGKDGQYWLAERQRWYEGFELPPKAFETFMEIVRSH